MLSVRLSQQLEEILDFLSMDSGLSKNQIVTKALEQYIRQADLGSVPLDVQITERSSQLYFHEEEQRKKQFQKAHEVASWAQELKIWTKDPRTAGHGAITPGIWGRNQVIGFSDSFNDDSIFVVSRHLPARPYAGTSSYHLELTPIDDWKKHMMPVDVKH